MKKCLCVLLAALFLLPGCGKKTQQQPAQPTTEPAATGLYDPDHPVEQQTMGAVRAYSLGSNSYTDIEIMGNKLLLTGMYGVARVLQGENCEVMADGTLGTGTIDYSVSAQQIAVYQYETREVVLLNPQLQEMNRIALPEDMEGEPAISLATNEIFYCANGEIRALNLENNVPRLVKVLTAGKHTLNGCYFDGRLICHEAADEEGRITSSYLSAQSGETLYVGGDIGSMDTYEDRYLVCRVDNPSNYFVMSEMIMGTLEGEPKRLDVPEADYYEEALAMNGVISCSVSETGVELSFHDLSLGQTTAKLTLEGYKLPTEIVADQQFVWMLLWEGDQLILCRWDVKQSAVAEPVAVTGPFYTAEAPDLQGLEECRKTADQMDSDYGVRIRIWQEAVKQTDGYTVVPEHQPAILNHMLTMLEPILQQFPQDFLRKTVRTGWIRICLVRSIAGDQEWVQFWEEGDCYILISSQADPYQAFLEAVWYAIDARVIGNSRDYDTWDQLNPEGFTYGLSEYDPAILEGENSAFMNERSLESPNEDRRQLFIAAMTGYDEEQFASELLQNKLRRLCEGIREAYGLERKEEIFLWEQYLTEPMVEIDG